MWNLQAKDAGQPNQRPQDATSTTVRAFVCLELTAVGANGTESPGLFFFTPKACTSIWVLTLGDEDTQALSWKKWG